MTVPVPPRGSRRAGALEGPASPAWRRLDREIRACRRCPLGASRTHAVVYRGGPRPLVVFVGEAPGADEDRVGRPFVGRGGRRLDAAVASAGLGPDEVGFVNVLKCRPPGNRFPPASIAPCRPFLDRQLELLAPRLVVPLGARALSVLDPSAPPITRSAGHLRTTGGRAMLPLLHPAAPLHDPRLRPRWTADVGALRSAVEALRREPS